METQPCSFVYVLCMATFVLKLQSSSRSGDCNGPQSLNYLLSGLLQIMCTYHCLKLSRGCPYACRSHLCGVKICHSLRAFSDLSTLAYQRYPWGAALHQWQLINTLAPTFHIWAYSIPTVRNLLGYQVGLSTVLTVLMKPPSLTFHST